MKRHSARIALLVGLFAGLSIAAVSGTVSRMNNNKLELQVSSGNDGWQLMTNGARAHFGTGSVDYCTSDGTNVVCPTVLDVNGVILEAQTTYPTSPGADKLRLAAYEPAVGGAISFNTADGFFGIPMPVGMTNLFTMLGTNGNWRTSGCIPFGYGSTTFNKFGDSSTATLCSAGNASCTASSPGWASTNLETRSPIIVETKTSPAASNIWCGLAWANTNSALQMWRGNTAGAGGFLWWTRIFIDAAPNDTLSINKMFAGITGAAALPVGTANPSALLNTAYFGFDLGEAQNLKFCTNDNVGSATCAASLGGNFPIQTGAWYDLYIFAKPNDTSIYGTAVRLDSAQNSGLLTASSDLPQNTVQLSWNVMLGSGGADTGVTAIGIAEVMTVWNF